MTLDDGQGAVAGVLHVLGVLDPGEPEPGLLPGEAGELAAAEELALVEAATEVEDRGALHDGVVEVEEGGGEIVAGDREDGLFRGLVRALFGEGFRFRFWFGERWGLGQSGLAGGLGRGLARQHAACGGGAPTRGSHPRAAMTRA